MVLSKFKKSSINKNKLRIDSFFLRIGLALVFLYAAVSALLNPNAWVGFFPSFLSAVFPAKILLLVHSIYQILLSLWLLSNKKIFYAAGLSSLTLFFIIIFNVGALDIIFRDIAILFSSLSLMVLSYNTK